MPRATNVIRRAAARRSVALGPLDPKEMTDAGMYAWGAILAVVGLVASYVIAVLWQRWKEKGRGA